MLTGSASVSGLMPSLDAIRCDMALVPQLLVESEQRPSVESIFSDQNHSEERLKRVAQELSAATGNDCLPVKADVRDPAQVKAAVQKTIERYGRIDFVINGDCNKYSSSSSSNPPVTLCSRRRGELSRPNLGPLGERIQDCD
jgi:hypothetical protein